MSFIHLAGNRFAAGDKEIFFRGVGVGSWLNLEHYELGIPGWETDIAQALREADPAFMQHFREAFFRVEDARYLRSLGVNLIRVPLNHHLFWDETTDCFLEDGIRELERLSRICQETGLYYMPDLHTAPGGQNPDWHSECRTGRPEFWHYAVFRKRTMEIWRKIAEKCCGDPMLLGYDLLNEPMLPKGDPETINRFYQETIKAVRAVDPNHLIFLEGNHFAMDSRGIHLPDDPQVTFTFHFYPSVWEPDYFRLPDAQRIRVLRVSLERIWQSMERRGRPVICSETGFERMPEKTESWMRASREVLEMTEEFGAGWCLWNYKDTGTIGLLSPNPSTPWMRMTQRIRGKWEHHRAEKLGYEIADLAGRKSGYELNPEEQYELQFMIRAGIAADDVRHILRPALRDLSADEGSHLAESFLLEQCSPWEPMEKLLKEQCCPQGGVRNET